MALNYNLGPYGPRKTLGTLWLLIEALNRSFVFSFNFELKGSLGAVLNCHLLLRSRFLPVRFVLLVIVEIILSLILNLKKKFSSNIFVSGTKVFTLFFFWFNNYSSRSIALLRILTPKSGSIYFFTNYLNNHNESKIKPSSRAVKTIIETRK